MDASTYWGWSAESGAGLLPRNWGLVMLRGVVALSVGAIAIAFPANALWAFTLVFAAFAFADGMLTIGSGVRGARTITDRWSALILRGLVGVAIGALFLLAPRFSMIGYAAATLALVALWSVGTGVFEIAAAVRLRREIRGEWLMVLSGILSILLGLAIPLLLLFLPAVAMLSVALMIGLYALCAGMILIALALRLRANRPRVPGM